MESFFPGQRYVSEGEPELGLGMVLKTGKGRVELVFPAANEVRIYAAANAPLRRVRFKPGEKIVDAEDRSLLIERVEEQDNLLMYLGEGRMVSEAHLGNVAAKHGVDDRLFMGIADSPNEFTLRRRTLENNHRLHNSSVAGFVGGRIDLIPHQLYIANEVSSRYAPRVLLSDEVGLGKTIEACLILHRLLLRGSISRVLILLPESLVHQWFVELLRRFNLWFHIFDEERCEAIEESAPDGNPFLDDQLVICSTGFLADAPKRAVQALGAGWDMLVVDEAHHLEWTPAEASHDYLVVEALSKVVEGLLLLTATPEQLGLQSHFARLRLLDPERYQDFEAFENEASDHRKTADIVDKLFQGKALNASDKKLLTALFGKARLDEIAKGGEAAQDNLIEDLLDQHGPGRVIFRNTRSAMQGFPARNAHLHPLSPTDATSTRPSIAKNPKFLWLSQLLSDLQPAKVLLICRTKGMVLALQKAILASGNLKAAIFHEGLTLVQRDRNAAWFAEPDGARLLLCSEIGSEGRNFQFAHHLVLFDLPEHPELLEQRIGRLDRIGQTDDIQIHVPYLKGSPEEVRVRWYHEGLNAFEQNMQGGNQIAQMFGERLAELSETNESPKFDQRLKALLADTRTAYTELRTKLANGRDRLLEINSFRPEIARKLIEAIKAEDQDDGLESYLITIFEHFGVEVEDLAPRTYLVKPSAQNADLFPSLSEDEVTITFDRTRALSREDIRFLSYDHPMVRDVIDKVLTSELGSVGFGMLRSDAPGILMELQFVLETVGGEGSQVDRFLPSTPLRVVVDHGGIDVSADFSVELFSQGLRPGHLEDLISNETLVETILPAMLEAATEIAKIRAKTKVSLGLRRMNWTLEHEIGRLKLLQEKNNHIRPAEIALATVEQERLAGLIEGAGVRLDAVLLIQKGDFA